MRDPQTFAAAYRMATECAGVPCAIEAGLFGNLADNECEHGRLPTDPTPPCGCWPQEITRDPVPAMRGRTRRNHRVYPPIGRVASTTSTGGST